MASLALILTAVSVLILAVRQDLQEHRVSNLLIVGALTAGVAIHWLAPGGGGAVHALAGAGVGLICLLPFYLLKGMGAGDVKLMAAAGSYLGPYDALLAAMLSLASGALIGILVLAWRVLEPHLRAAGASATAGAAERDYVALSQLRKQRFPYAAAIALGTVLTMWMNGMMGEMVP